MHDHNHSHSHDHGHHHHVSPADMASGAFIIGIALNTLYVIAEAIFGFANHSMALLSDAGHNLGDVASLVLSLFAFRLAKVKPSSTYTYGYKKTTILASLTNAVILLIAIGMLGYESVRRLDQPEPVPGGVIAWVSALGIAVNGITAYLFHRKGNELNTRGAYLHMLADAVVSLVVVVSGIIIQYTHWYWIDPAISIIVLLVILYSTWSLLTDSLRLSLDAVPPDMDVEDITAHISKMPEVQDIHHVHIWAMSTTENALTAHVVLNESLSFDQKMKVVHSIKHELEHHNINHATIELESAAAPCENDDC
ncbi:MAG: cation diffusion facilitator family transporter [Flavipsychrobacter sp.]